MLVPPKSVCGQYESEDPQWDIKEWPTKTGLCAQLMSPLAWTRRLKPCPKVRNGKQPGTYFTVYRFCIEENDIIRK